MTTAPEWKEIDDRTFRRYELVVDHGLVDDKGRTIGGVAIIDDRRPVNPPDRRFELEIRTLRNGRQFGAIRPSSFFESLENAQREAGKRLARQRKGFAKLYGAKP